MSSHKDNNDKHKQGIRSDILVSYQGSRQKCGRTKNTEFEITSK